MKDWERSEQVVSQWLQRHAGELSAVRTPADLGRFTEKLNAHLQETGAVPVVLSCGCCTLLGIDLYPHTTADGLQFEVRPIRKPKPADVH